LLLWLIFKRSLERFQPFHLNAFTHIDKNLYNYDVETKNIYLKAMESFLFYNDKAWNQQNGGNLNG